MSLNFHLNIDEIAKQMLVKVIYKIRYVFYVIRYKAFSKLTLKPNSNR